MGNFCSTPHRRLEYEVRLDQNDKELVRHTLRQIADHAQVSAQLGRERQERRRQKNEASHGQNGQRKSRQRQPGRHNSSDEMYYATVPDQPYGPRGGVLPSPKSPLHQGPQGLPPRAAGVYGNYPGYQPAALNGDDDEEQFGDDVSEGLGSPGRQYGNFQARAPKFAARGRARQMPHARRPKEQEEPQDAAAAFMGGGSPSTKS